MTYSNDSKFTETVHKELGSKIYDSLGWSKIILTKENQYDLEMNHGVNHVFSKDLNIINVQERFRDTKYSKYTDFTLRYRRDNSNILVNKRSEFFKTKANFLVYGITNNSKTTQSTDFLKYAVINLNYLFELFDTGKILINDKINFSVVINNVLNVPLKHNSDGSSSFVVLDILMLKKFPNVIYKSLNY